MSRRRPPVLWFGAALIAGAVGLSACAPAAVPTPSPDASEEPTSTPSPEPYAGPLLFTGDELDAFAPSADEIAATIPGAANISALTPTLQQVADGFGAEFAPSVCITPFLELSLGSIGARSMTWDGADGSDRQGHLIALQFADDAQAQRRMDDYVAAAEACGTFTVDDEPATFDIASLDDGAGVRSLAGVLRLPTFSSYVGFTAVGNVVVEFRQPFSGEPAFDAVAAATLLSDDATDARDALIAALTTDPPAAPAEADDADAAAPWSSWEIGFPGVGPLHLGEDLDDVLVAVPGAQVGDGVGDTERRLQSADGAILTVIREDDGRRVASIRAGDVGLYGGTAQDGSVLPRAGGVGIGDPVSAATSAFPGGTSVHVISAGLDFYEVPTRQGGVLLFHTDGPATDPGSTIIGITAEDGLLRREYGYAAIRG